MEITMIKNIAGFDGYLVDDLGNIYSLYKKGNMIPRKNKDGYLVIGLRKDKKSYYKLVHRLVAQMFIPNPENKLQVNHKNGSRADNRVENLEWCTQSENNLHSYRVLHRKPSKPGFGKLGKSNPKSKVVLQIKNNKIIAEFYGMNEASRLTGVKAGNICNCCKNNIKTAGGYQWKYKDC